MNNSAAIQRFPLSNQQGAKHGPPALTCCCRDCRGRQEKKIPTSSREFAARNCLASANLSVLQHHVTDNTSRNGALEAAHPLGNMLEGRDNIIDSSIPHILDRRSSNSDDNDTKTEIRRV